jgi:hypothetical protein
MQPLLKFSLGNMSGWPLSSADDLVGRAALPISQRANPRILLAAGFGERGHQSASNFSQRFFSDSYSAAAFFSKRRRVIPVPPPIRPQVLLEILDRILVVVGQHEPAGDGPGQPGRATAGFFADSVEWGE